MKQPIVVMRNLSKSYDGLPILKELNLTIYPGEIIGYIGPNGAGKSTTVKILAGLITEFQGELLINGISIKDDPLAAKAEIGYVPELAALYEVLTPNEYFMFVGGLHGLDEEVIIRRATNFLQAFSLSDYADVPMDTFSKGMRQKVLIIAGILHNPTILILDEPLSGLDANAVIVIKELITQLATRGKTIFYCSHIMDVVEKVSDRIVLLQAGEIIAQGTMEELKQREGQSLEQLFSTLTQESQQLTYQQDLNIALQDFN